MFLRLKDRTEKGYLVNTAHITAIKDGVAGAVVQVIGGESYSVTSSVEQIYNAMRGSVGIAIPKC